MANSVKKPTARVGFQLSDPNVHDITGYCAAEMAIEKANAEWNLPFTVELVPVIDQRDEQISRKAAGQFVDDPLAVGMLGPINSAMAVITQDIYNASGLAQLSSEASSPLLTSRGYNNFFRLVANDEVQGRELGKAAVKYLKGQRIAVLSDNTAWGKPIAEIFSAEAERLGSKPALMYFFGEKEERLDFDEIVQTTLDCKPDLVYFAVYWNKAHILAHRLRVCGLKAVYLGSDALKPYAFLEVPSLDDVSPYHSLAGIDMRIKPTARAFYEAFAVKFPMLLVAPQYAPEAYDAASLLLEAMRRAGDVDRGKVLKELQNIGTYQGSVGEIRFDEKGDLVGAEIGLYQCIDGLRHYIGSLRDLIKT